MMVACGWLVLCISTFSAVFLTKAVTDFEHRATMRLFSVCQFNPMSLKEPGRISDLDKCIDADLLLLTGTKFKKMDRDRPYWVQRTDMNYTYVHWGWTRVGCSNIACE